VRSTARDIRELLRDEVVDELLGARRREIANGLNQIDKRGRG
jgi:hypothetical protein